MSTLHDRLADLAGDADTRPETALPASGLWDRGRRYSRLRRGGTTLIMVTAVAVVAGVLGTAQLRATPSPAPAGSPVGVPERIFAPSPYLEGTEDGGPLGRLAALISADRGGLWGSDEGYVGVSAETGEYRFLDLPDIAPLGEAALSPDGRRVAYWTTGPTRDTSNTNDGEPPATGVALYDPATGDVVRHDIPTQHGLTQDVLDWVDGDTVIINFGQYVAGDDGSQMDQSSGRVAPTLLWDVEDPAPRVVESGPLRRASGDVSGHAGQVVLGTGERTWVVVPGDRPADVRRFRTSQSLWSSVSVGPDGRWAATIWGGPQRGQMTNPNRLVGGPLPESVDTGVTEVGLPVLPGSRRYSAVVGWADASTVLARGRRGGWERGRVAIDAIDLRDGRTETAVVGPPESSGVFWQVATDLLREPTVEAVEPPRPMSPRRTAGLLGLTVVGAAGALLWWRRRVRP